MSKFPLIFTPLTIRGKTYKNRLIAAPTMFAHAIFTIPEMKESIYRMIEARAKGGFACVSTGEHPVNAEEGTALFYVHAIDFTKFEGADFEAFKEYADRIKKHGALSYLEFCHEGAQAEKNPPFDPWGPEGYIREDGVEVKAMDRAMMDKVCVDYYNIARYARECGFDGVMVHGGHGFNIQQFVSPWTNHRTDEFGGSMENRARFPVMLFDAVRRGIGEDMIMELRFSAEDGVQGGMTIEDTVEFCKHIDGLVDIIHISNGLKWAGSRTHTFTSFLEPHCYNLEFSAKVKAAVKKSKVAVIGGFNSPQQCEDALAAGKTDFIAMGRQCFADPEFPNKARNGKADHIRSCVRCFQCYPGFTEHETDVPLIEKGLSMEQVKEIYTPSSMGRCAINPRTGFLFYPEKMPEPEGSRKVLIVGGGPGGLQATITCAERGHRVVLLEKTGSLGGVMNFTDTDDDKVDLRNFKDLLIKEANESGADILLHTVMTRELLDDIIPDVILLAVGGKPVKPSIKGIQRAVDAVSLYRNPEKIGKTAVVVGGGLVGCETALYLASLGCDVTVIEMQDMMAFETFGYYRNALLETMDARGIHQLLGARCTGFEDGGVRVKQDGNELFVPADTCVFSLGIEPDFETVEQQKALAGDVPVIAFGDCSRTGKMGDAVRGGYMAAMEII